MESVEKAFKVLTNYYVMDIKAKLKVLGEFSSSNAANAANFHRTMDWLLGLVTDQIEIAKY